MQDQLKHIIDQFFQSHPKVLDWASLDLSKYEESPGYKAFIQRQEAGMYGQLNYMHKYNELRRHPKNMEPWAESIVLFLIPYPQKFTPYSASQELKPVVSSYARGEDYHLTARKINAALHEQLIQAFPEFKMRPFADSAPVLERQWAQEAGLGWIGKNSCLLRKDIGSGFFIAGFLMNQKLEQKREHNQNFCGNCSSCMSHCPVNAIPDRGSVDANKCLSAWTIEYKETLPESIAANSKGRIFGCDICQQVCPWNQKHLVSSIEDTFSLSIDEWKALSKPQGGFKSFSKETPLQRAGRKKLAQNLDQIFS